MRHGKKTNHLGRTASHRAALLSNLASSLILHKRIKTTVAKARELRKYVEPLLTKSKSDSTQSRRTVFAYLQNKDSVKELFDVVADKIATRPGGYSRIIKLGTRQGDNAEMCIIELVDFNETLLAAQEAKSAKTRRSRRSGGSKAKAAAPVAEVEAPAIEEAQVVEAADEVATDAVEVAETRAAEEAPATEASSDEAPAAETSEEGEEQK